MTNNMSNQEAEGTPPPSDDLGPSLFEQIYELWVDPELAARGMSQDRDTVDKALVIMAPGLPPQTLINREVTLIATVRATRAMEAGESVTEDDFDDVTALLPQDVDPNAGWVCFARLGGQAYIAFDFRRNKARATQLLERAREFLETARLALSRNLVGPAVDNAYSATELVACAQMYSIEDTLTHDHRERRRWFSDWTTLGNAPTEHSKTLAVLAKHRGAARYGEKTVKLKSDRLTLLLDTVDEAIKFADSRLATTVDETMAFAAVAAADIRRGSFVSDVS